MNILKFTLKDTEIEMVVDSKSISYVFEIEGDRYGNKINISSKKTQDIVSATFLLLTNALESIEQHENKRIS